MDYSIAGLPALLSKVEAKSIEIGFTMPSDRHIGSFLRSLIRSKPGGNFLELGTGIGLSLVWMVDGMDESAQTTSVDNDPALIEISQKIFSGIVNLDLVCEDGSFWIKNYLGKKFDLIFADAWPGKYSELDQVLSLLTKGGFYVIDDMKSQPNWPDGHESKVDQLVKVLEERSDLIITKFDWSTGVIMAVKS